MNKMLRFSFSRIAVTEMCRSKSEPDDIMSTLGCLIQGGGLNKRGGGEPLKETNKRGWDQKFAKNEFLRYQKELFLQLF